MDKINFNQDFKLEYLKLLEEISKIPSPTFNEKEKGRFIANYLKINHIDYKIDDVGNIIVSYAKNDKCIFAAHYDTVFPMETKLNFVKLDNYLCCPSIGDNSANVAALLIFLKYLNDDLNNSNLEFIFSVNEEGLGNLGGIKHYFKNYNNDVKEFIAVDLGYESISNNCVGSYRYKITINTKGGHSFGDFGNENAIVIASSIIMELNNIELPKVKESKTTFNIGTITGGTTINTIAANCSFSYEFRSDNDKCLEYMENTFNNIISKYDVLVENIGIRPTSSNLDSNKENDLVNKISNIIEKYSGNKPKIISSSMDFNIPMSLGIASSSIGVYDKVNAHSIDERIDINCLDKGLKMLYELIKTYMR